VPANSVAVGVPAQIKPDLSSEEAIRGQAASYVANGRRSKDELRLL
jgi:serine acetyltransferase